jgi:hypothetical protein
MLNGEWLRPSDVARELQQRHGLEISVWSVYSTIARGELPAFRINARVIKVRRSDFDQWVRNMQPAQQEAA